MSWKIICSACGATSDFCIIKQVQEHFYKYYFAMEQLEECHGDESLLTQKCLSQNCNHLLEADQ